MVSSYFDDQWFYRVSDCPLITVEHMYYNYYSTYFNATINIVNLSILLCNQDYQVNIKVDIYQDFSFICSLKNKIRVYM